MTPSKLCFFQLVILAFAVVGASPVAHPVALPLQSYRDAHAGSVLAARDDRQFSGQCFGTGSICGLSITLDRRCNSLSSTEQYDKQVECQCSSGVTAGKIACGNCKRFYRLTGASQDDSLWTDPCVSRAVPIAPLPSDVLASWAAFNATRSAPPPPASTTTGAAEAGGCPIDIYSSVSCDRSGPATAVSSRSTTQFLVSGPMTTLDGFVGQTVSGGAPPTAAAAATTTTSVAGAVAASDAAERGWLAGLLSSLLMAMVAL